MRHMVNVSASIWVLLAGITSVGQATAAPMPPDAGKEFDAGNCATVGHR